MSAPDFFFSLALSGDDTVASMVQQVAADVVGYADCPELVPDIHAAIERALRNATAVDPRCTLECRSVQGSIHLVVTSGTAVIWQQSVSG